MEHIIITALPDGFYHLAPSEGYVLVNTITNMRHSEAVTSTPREFVAIPA